MALISFQNTAGGCLQPVANTFETYDPLTGKPWALIPRDGTTEVDAAVAAAKVAFRSKEWGGITATARCKLLVRVADLIAQNAERIAALETRDNGKLIAEMTAQLRYIPEWFRYFGGLADKIEGSVLPIDKVGMFAFTRHEPLGVIVAIVPWNSPLLLLTSKLAALLAAGNTVVIKPSEHASDSTLEFANLFEQVGFPPGGVNTVTGMPMEVSVPLVSHPDVAKITFTGGEPGGIAVYRAAAEGLKTVTLELGGKSANIVFDDANIESAVNSAISGIFAASGQTCIAGSRLLVHRSVHDQIVDGVVKRAASARIDNLALTKTQVGPITTEAQRAKVLSYLDVARGEGAECILSGGKQAAVELADGWFVESSIFTGVNNSMCIAREEVSGPILSVNPFDDEDKAFAIANDSPYGLAAGLWTANMGRALCGAPRPWRRARFGSKPIVPSAIWRPSVATRGAASDAKAGKRLSTPTSKPKRSGSTPSARLPIPSGSASDGRYGRSIRIRGDYWRIDRRQFDRFLPAQTRFFGDITVDERDLTYQHSSTPLSAASIRTQFGTPVDIHKSLFGANFLRRIKERFGPDADVGFVECVSARWRRGAGWPS